MHTLLVFLLAAGVLASPSSGFGDEPPPRVVAVEIEGARRTRGETVRRLGRVKEGDPWRDGLDAEVRQNLLNTGIFYEVAVEPQPAAEGVRLRIELKEKWTLIPLPLFSVKDGETTWGATVVESNLLGTGSRLIALLAVTEGEPGGRILYIDPHLRGSLFQFFGALGFTDEVVDIWGADEKTGSYRQETAGATVALGYRFARRTSASVGVRMTDFTFSEPAGGAVPPGDARERALVLQLRHEGTDLDEERRRGLFSELRLEFGIEPFGDEVGRTAAEGTARWAHTFANGHTLGLFGHGLWTDTVDYEEGARTPTGFLRGYDADRFRPDRLLGGSVEYQRPVARFREATLSVVPFADAALLRDANHAFTAGDAQVDAGLALAIYVRRVALPVLQLYGAYGFSSGEVLPGFSLGVVF